MKVKLRQRNIENPKEWIEKIIYLDGILKSNLDISIKQLHKDWDSIWFCDGAEGSGKSVLAITGAYYVSPEERRHSLIDRIIIKIEDAPEIIKEAKPFDSIVIDESFGGMSSAGFMSKLNKMLQRLFTEIRAKNLFIFIVAPTFMDINRYFAIWRSKCLLHVYSTKSERGYCSFFNSDKKKKLYILGRKQFYNYQVVQPNFRFRFTNCAKTCIDWDEYIRRKRAKNLVVEDEDYIPPKFIKNCWIQVRKEMQKLTKPLTQQQFSELNSMCVMTIRRYDKALRENKEHGTHNIINLKQTNGKQNK